MLKDFHFQQFCLIKLLWVLPKSYSRSWQQCWGPAWKIVSDLWPESSCIGFTPIKVTDWALCLQETFCCCVVRDPCWAILCPFIVYSLHVGTGLSDGSTGWVRLHCHANGTQIYILPQTNIHCDVSIRSPLMDNNFSKTTVFFESAN